MTEKCLHITISSMMLWQMDRIKTAVYILGGYEKNCKKGVFIDRDFFEPFYVQNLVNSQSVSKVIQLVNKN